MIFGPPVNPAKVCGETLPKIEERDSALAQFGYASVAKTEEAYLAVLKYYPETEDSTSQQRHYAALARKALICLYLDDARYDLALEHADYLANLPSTEQEHRAFGIAGQAIVYSYLGDSNRAADRLAEALVLRDHLHEDMRQRLKDAGLARDGEFSIWSKRLGRKTKSYWPKKKSRNVCC